jgi:murein DD-endopeptidase MepM/ murein hydrolase activator NlpD
MLRYFIAIFLFFLLSCQQDSAADAQKPKRQLEPVLCCDDKALKPGSNFFQLLTTDVKLPVDIANRMVFMAKDSIDLTRLKPRDIFRNCWLQDSSFFRISYIRPNYRQMWHIDWFPAIDSMRIYNSNRFVKTDTLAISVKIETSLYEALQDKEALPVVFEMADIFQWEFDFLTETRVGDSLNVVYTQYVIDNENILLDKVIYASYNGKLYSNNIYYYPVLQGYYDKEGGSTKRTFLRSPLSYRRISSGFSTGRYHPILKIVRPHHGIDFAAPKGTPVSASADGVVDYVGKKGGLGNAVFIRHNSVYRTAYGHLWRYARDIRKGKRVSQGQVIGYVGKTGMATGYHLHYTMYRYGKPIDPFTMKNPPGKEIPDSLQADFFKYRSDFNDWLNKNGMHNSDDAGSHADTTRSAFN